MMSEIFRNVTTSGLALGVDGLILAAALVVGFLPFARFLPVVGPYVPAAKIVAVLVAAVICFKLGFRLASEQEEAGRLRATIAAQKADLDNAAKSAADATQRASEIEASANAQHETDAQYIRSLALRPEPGCLLDDGDIPSGLRKRPADASGARSAAGRR
ncbi:hypothetical protein [Bradyrhizobium sp. McL0615]|uniref:hypothetical protein n=1 Tax=Bradyrhizobium sp. McL0615 TaxID=3415673 RepID=UPI003CF046E2